MMAGLYHVTDHCARTLKLNAEIEVYVNQDSRFNAACYPPMKDKVLLFLTSALLEKFSQQELAFVIGHELGHYLFEHTRFPVDYILQNHGGQLSPLHAMKMYAWIRNAEITADRVGMICCGDFDVAAHTFFKLSSGITTAAFQFNLKDYLAQLDDLQGEVSGQEADPQDWFSTHPFNPMRLKALDRKSTRLNSSHPYISPLPPHDALPIYLAQLDALQGEVSGQEADPQDWFSTHPFNPMRLKA